MLVGVGSLLALLAVAVGLAVVLIVLFEHDATNETQRHVLHATAIHQAALSAKAIANHQRGYLLRSIETATSSLSSSASRSVKILLTYLALVLGVAVALWVVRATLRPAFTLSQNAIASRHLRRMRCRPAPPAYWPQSGSITPERPFVPRRTGGSRRARTVQGSGSRRGRGTGRPPASPRRRSPWREFQ